MTYYYVVIGILFVGLYTIVASDINQKDKDLYVLGILLLGSFSSMLWHWSCKGYYYWIIHWAKLVDKHEKKIGFEVHSVFDKKEFNTGSEFFEKGFFCPTSAANFSTSKITLLFSFVVSIVCLWLFFIKIFFMGLPTSTSILQPLHKILMQGYLTLCALALALTLYFFCSGIASKYLKSDISKKTPITFDDGRCN